MSYNSLVLLKLFQISLLFHNLFRMIQNQKSVVHIHHEKKNKLETLAVPTLPPLSDELLHRFFF